MRKKNNLPESLELLLDTMCNTFGAIMFIAISLVVISQIVTKIVHEMQPQKVDEAFLEKMRNEVRTLENTVVDLEHEQAKKALIIMGLQKEKREVAEKLLALKTANQKMILELREQQLANRVEGKKLEMLQSEVMTEKAEARQIEIECKEKERALAQMLLSLQENKEELSKRIFQAQQEVIALNKHAAKTTPQMLTFSMEEETYGLDQYVICLKKGKIYREKKGEVTRMRDSEFHGHFQFSGHGNRISENPSQELGSLLSELTRHHFANVFCDESSYASLVALRKFLRSRGIRMHIIQTEEFDFSFGAVKASY